MISHKVLYKKKRYGIIGCLKCHTLNITNLFQKTHKCLGCGCEIPIDKVHVIFGSDNVREVSAYLKAQKMKG